jgi:uncharacterized protein YbjT (DUF2867 family)
MAIGARTAWLAGATGLIGRELLARLQADARWQAVHVFGRRAVPAGPKLRSHVVDFAALPNALPNADDLFVALGTTIKVAGSQAAFRAVDFDAVLAIARAGRAAGATRLAVVSALGADASARVFYNRVKGEMEAAVAGLGYASVTFAQPSLLAGDRKTLGQPERPGEVWATRLLAPVLGLVPKGIRPIAAHDVAAALVEAVAAGAPGVARLSSAAMQGAARR